MIDRGARLVKVGATGFSSDGEQFASLGPRVLDMAVRTAHEAGLKIAAHCVGYEGTRQAVEAGIDSVEHGSFVDEETVQLMAQRGTYLVPTMSTWDARARVGSMLGILAKEDLADVEYRRENSKASFRRAVNAGVKIAAGSDAGGSAARHGFLAREIELMVESGMTPKAALESATREGATLMGIEDQTGTIEVGKQADMVLIDGDLLSNPGALRNVWGVFLGGRRVL